MTIMDENEAEKICKELKELNFDAEVSKNYYALWLTQGIYFIKVTGRQRKV